MVSECIYIYVLTQTKNNRVVLQYSSIIYAQTFIVKQPHTQSMHGSSHWPWNKTGHRQYNY